MKRISNTKGFTLIELLVVIAIIALLSSVVTAALAKSRVKARDSARVQNARQIALALEQYEQSNNTYKIANAGLNNEGGGYVSKGDETPGYTTSISSALKSGGFYNSSKLIDPVFGTDNYYVGVCTSTNAYNVFIKLEQPELSQATSTLANACGGTEATALGFNYVASTVGGTSGGQLAGGGSSGGGGGGGDISFGGLTYKTVIAEDGKVWLDRNLGATQVATAYNDYLAYGDLYQWGRLADGHEKINRTGPTTATVVNGTTATLSTTATPLNNLFVALNTSPYDWVAPKIDTLWQGVGGTNNPCPTGFRVPTQSEWANLVSTAGIANYNTAYSSTLKLTAAGTRSGQFGGTFNNGSNGNYWSSTVTVVSTYFLNFHSGAANPASTSGRSFGLSVRCIKD